jgi:hypothetical protein
MIDCIFVEFRNYRAQFLFCRGADIIVVSLVKQLQKCTMVCSKRSMPVEKRSSHSINAITASPGIELVDNTKIKYVI